MRIIIFLLLGSIITLQAQDRDETMAFIREKLVVSPKLAKETTPSLMSLLGLESTGGKVYYTKVELEKGKMEIGISYGQGEHDLKANYTLPLSACDPERVEVISGTKVRVYATGDRYVIDLEVISGDETLESSEYQMEFVCLSPYRAERLARALAHLIELEGGTKEVLFSEPRK